MLSQCRGGQALRAPRETSARTRGQAQAIGIPRTNPSRCVNARLLRQVYDGAGGAPYSHARLSILSELNALRSYSTTIRPMTTAERGSPDMERTASRFFAEPMREYVLQCLGRPVSVLQAGCLAPLRELGIAELAQGGFEVSVTAVDGDHPLARQVLLDAHSAYDDVITGDLRTVPIPQRAFDVVYCAALLERVSHVELVLDRLTSALKPGGLLFVRTADRYSATALLDRMLPGPARRGGLARFRPGIPGPFPAVYEKAVSEEGIASYALMRGLVIAARTSELTRPDQPAGLSSSVRFTCAAIARLSRGRYDDSHDELLYVIRKPLDRFARVVLARGVAQTRDGGARGRWKPDSTGRAVIPRGSDPPSPPGHARWLRHRTGRAARGAGQLAGLDPG